MHIHIGSRFLDDGKGLSLQFSLALQIYGDVQSKILTLLSGAVLPAVPVIAFLQNRRTALCFGSTGMFFTV